MSWCWTVIGLILCWLHKLCIVLWVFEESLQNSLVRACTALNPLLSHTSVAILFKLSSPLPSPVTKAKHGWYSIKEAWIQRFNRFRISKQSDITKFNRNCYKHPSFQSQMSCEKFVMQYLPMIKKSKISENCSELNGGLNID